MDWGIVGTSVLAGGIVGQIFTIFCTNYLTDKREYKKWRLTERHKGINELLDVLTLNPQGGDGLSQWTHQIRNASLKIHVLYKNGQAPKELTDALEAVFQLAKEKKSGTESEDWSTQFKTTVSNVRKQLSNHINDD